MIEKWAKQNRTLCSFQEKRPAIVPLARIAKVREKERELTMSTDEAYTTLHHEGNDLAGLLGERKKSKNEGENMQVWSNG